MKVRGFRVYCSVENLLRNAFAKQPVRFPGIVNAIAANQGFQIVGADKFVEIVGLHIMTAQHGFGRDAVLRGIARNPETIPDAEVEMDSVCLGSHIPRVGVDEAIGGAQAIILGRPDFGDSREPHFHGGLVAQPNRVARQGDFLHKLMPPSI